jgi:CzcA family heavy metal efflux pump
MWLVRFALKRPYSVAAMVLLIIVTGLSSYMKLPVDVLPKVDIPSIKLIWTYKGLNAKEMAAKVTTFSEVAIMNNVDNIKSIRSQTMSGTAIVHVDFQSGVDIANAMSQATSVSQTIIRRMPQGITPPLITQYNQSSQPIIQLAISSDTLSSAQVADYARLRLRGMIQSIKGVRMTLPYGGASRVINIDLRPQDLQAHKLTPDDVSRALAQQNLTLPTGSIRINGNDLQLLINAAPETVDEIAQIPVKTGQAELIQLRDVADVRDGSAVQTNIARVNGKEGVLVSLIKLGNASTTEIIESLKQRLPEIQRAAPSDIEIKPIFDQSTFVVNAQEHIKSEMLLVGLLVALVIILFLGSMRATLIVLTSIPLSLMVSIAVLHLTGHTLNLMSLGGLALAIGILVDNALVEIENIERLLHEGNEPQQAALTSANQVALPELISTLSICVVFGPIFLLDGVAGYIFRPMALVVISALIASYLLSRTLVPLLSVILLKRSTGRPNRIHDFVVALTQRTAERFVGIAETAQKQGFVTLVSALMVLALGAGALLYSGQTFFPKTDAGLIKIYLRTVPGGRIENTAASFAEVQKKIRDIIPAHEIDSIVENIGTPESVNLAWVQSFNVGSYDGEILIQLKSPHQPTASYLKRIRHMLKTDYPAFTMVEQAADITNQTLSGTSPANIEVQFRGKDTAHNLELAEQLMTSLVTLPDAVDISLQQVLKLPSFDININRVKAAKLGLDTRTITSSILAALGAANSVSSNFWSDPASGFSYEVQSQVPLLRLDSESDLLNLPVGKAEDGKLLKLADIATIKPKLVPATVGRTNLRPTFSVLINVEDDSLGALYTQVEQAVKKLRPQLSPGNSIDIAGQAKEMKHTFSTLLTSFAMVLFLVYIIMLFNFSSWLLPIVALSSVPFALSGALLMLFITHTPLSVPAIMGFVMVIGVTTANSVLMTSFAKDLWYQGVSANQAAFSAIRARFRPVLMTALTMIVGLLPMALAMSQGGEQNAPLARAVIGGLLIGTLSTFIIVPLCFNLIASRIKPSQQEVV